MHDNCEVQSLDLSVVDSDVDWFGKVKLMFSKFLEIAGLTPNIYNTHPVLFCTLNCCRGYCSRCAKSVQVGRSYALRAAFLVPILLVVAQPVRLCSAGMTVHGSSETNRVCRMWRGTTRVVVPLPARTHSSPSPFWRKFGTWNSRATITSVQLEITTQVL